MIKKIATAASALVWLLALASVVYAIEDVTVPAGESVLVECEGAPGFGVHAVAVQVDSDKVRVDCALAPVPVPTYTPTPVPQQTPVPAPPRRIGPPERVPR